MSIGLSANKSAGKNVFVRLMEIPLNINLNDCVTIVPFRSRRRLLMITEKNSDMSLCSKSC